MKICAHCKESKLPEDFDKQKSSPDGLQYWCRFCSNGRDRDRAAYGKIWRDRKKAGLPNPPVPSRKEREHKKKRNPYSRYKAVQCVARRRGRQWFLSFPEWYSLVQQPCFYGKDCVMTETGIGLDRLDHLKEYEVGNCVSCCHAHNWLKGRIEALGFRYPRTVELVQELIMSGVIPVTPKAAWASREREKTPWVREKHGETIAAPNFQASNIELANENVLQERAEPVGKSAAFPLMGGLGDKQTGGIAPTSGII